MQRFAALLGFGSNRDQTPAGNAGGGAVYSTYNTAEFGSARAHASSRARVSRRDDSLVTAVVPVGPPRPDSEHLPAITKLSDALALGMSRGGNSGSALTWHCPPDAVQQLVSGVSALHALAADPTPVAPMGAPFINSLSRCLWILLGIQESEPNVPVPSASATGGATSADHHVRSLMPTKPVFASISTMPTDTAVCVECVLAPPAASEDSATDAAVAKYVWFSSPPTDVAVPWLPQLHQQTTLDHDDNSDTSGGSVSCAIAALQLVCSVLLKLSTNVENRVWFLRALVPNHMVALLTNISRDLADFMPEQTMHAAPISVTPTLLAALRLAHQAIAVLSECSGSGHEWMASGWAPRRQLAALLEACVSGHMSVVRRLLLLATSIQTDSKDGEHALHQAVMQSQVEVVKVLATFGTSINGVQSKRPPLAAAAAAGLAVSVQCLLELGADVNAVDADGVPVIAHAVAGGSPEITQLLLSRGAKLEIPSNSNPLVFTAAARGFTAIVDQLLTRGADWSARSNVRMGSVPAGMHAALAAAWGGHTDIVALLLDRQVNVNLSDTDGDTLLHAAAATGNRQLVDELLRRGARSEQRNKAGIMPLSAASWAGSPPCVTLIELAAEGSAGEGMVVPSVECIAKWQSKRATFGAARRSVPSVSPFKPGPGGQVAPTAVLQAERGAAQVLVTDHVLLSVLTDLYNAVTAIAGALPPPESASSPALAVGIAQAAQAVKLLVLDGIGRFMSAFPPSSGAIPEREIKAITAIVYGALTVRSSNPLMSKTDAWISMIITKLLAMHVLRECFLALDHVARTWNNHHAADPLLRAINSCIDIVAWATQEAPEALEGRVSVSFASPALANLVAAITDIGTVSPVPAAGAVLQLAAVPDVYLLQSAEFIDDFSGAVRSYNLLRAGGFVLDHGETPLPSDQSTPASSYVWEGLGTVSAQSTDVILASSTGKLGCLPIAAAYAIASLQMHQSAEDIAADPTVSHLSQMLAQVGTELLNCSLSAAGALGESGPNVFEHPSFSHPYVVCSMVSGLLILMSIAAKDPHSVSAFTENSTFPRLRALLRPVPQPAVTPCCVASSPMSADQIASAIPRAWLSLGWAVDPDLRLSSSDLKHVAPGGVEYSRAEDSTDVRFPSILHYVWPQPVSSAASDNYQLLQQLDEPYGRFLSSLLVTSLTCCVLEQVAASGGALLHQDIKVPVSYLLDALTRGRSSNVTIMCASRALGRLLFYLPQVIRPMLLDHSAVPVCAGIIEQQQTVMSKLLSRADAAVTSPDQQLLLWPARCAAIACMELLLAGDDETARAQVIYDEYASSRDADGTGTAGETGVAHVLLQMLRDDRVSHVGMHLLVHLVHSATAVCMSNAHGALDVVAGRIGDTDRLHVTGSAQQKAAAVRQTLARARHQLIDLLASALHMEVPGLGGLSQRSLLLVLIALRLCVRSRTAPPANSAAANTLGCLRHEPWETVALSHADAETPADFGRQFGYGLRVQTAYSARGTFSMTPSRAMVEDVAAHPSVVVVPDHQNRIRQQDNGPGSTVMLLINLFDRTVAPTSPTPPSDPNSFPVFPARVMESILLTLTSLLAFNTAAKQWYARNDSGYENVHTRVRRLAFDGTCHRCVVRALVCMVLDGSHVAGTLRISNSDAVGVLFRVLPSLSAELQSDVLVDFHRFVAGDGNTWNRAVCSHSVPPVMDLLLDALPQFAVEEQEHTVAIVQELGSHTVSVKQLKAIFRLLHSPEREVPAKAWDLLRALRHTLERPSGPSRYFAFDGHCSGLQFVTMRSELMSPTAAGLAHAAVVKPGMPSWPMHGYSFNIWIRMDSLPSSPDGKPPTPHIFSALDMHHRSLRLFLDDRGVLTVAAQASKSSSKKEQRVSYGVTLQPVRWYCIGITHKSPRGWAGGTSDFTVYLDGVPQPVCQLKYPNFKSPPIHVFVGAAAEVLSNDGPGSGPPLPADPYSSQRLVPRMMPHCYWPGQAGGLYMFDTALSAAQMAGIHALGPSYMFTFDSALSDVRPAHAPMTPERPLSLPDAATAELSYVLNDEYADVEATAAAGASDARGRHGSISWDGTASGVVIPSSPANDREDPEHTPTPVDPTQVVLDGSMTSMLLLSVNAGVWDQELFLDNSHRRWARDIVGVHARRFPGTYCCITTRTRDIMESLGGVVVLFPLFACINRLTRSSALQSGDDGLSVDVDDDTDADVPSAAASAAPTPVSALADALLNAEEAPDQHLVERIISVLLSLVISSPTNQEELHKYDGLRLISCLLQLVSPVHLSNSCLASIEGLVDSFAPLKNSPLFAQSVKYLMGNFRLWSLAHPAVQVEHAQMLLRQVRQRPREYRDIIGVSTIIGAFYEYLYVDNSSAGPIRNRWGKARGTLATFDQHRQRVFRRPTGLELEDIREALCESLFVMITGGDGVVPDDLETLRQFVCVCSEISTPATVPRSTPTACADVLDLMSRILDDPTHGRSVYRWLNAGHEQAQAQERKADLFLRSSTAPGADATAFMAGLAVKSTPNVTPAAKTRTRASTDASQTSQSESDAPLVMLLHDLARSNWECEQAAAISLLGRILLKCSVDPAPDVPDWRRAFGVNRVEVDAVAQDLAHGILEGHIQVTPVLLRIAVGCMVGHPETCTEARAALRGVQSGNYRSDRLFPPLPWRGPWLSAMYCVQCAALRRATPELKLAGLEALIELCSERSEAPLFADTIMKAYGWQTLLLPVLTEDIAHREDAVSRAVMRLFVALHSRAIARAPVRTSAYRAGSSVVEETLVATQLLSDLLELDAIETCCRMLGQLFSCMHQVTMQRCAPLDLPVVTSCCDEPVEACDCTTKVEQSVHIQLYELGLLLESIILFPVNAASDAAHSSDIDYNVAKHVELFHGRDHCEAVDPPSVALHVWDAVIKFVTMCLNLRVASVQAFDAVFSPPGGAASASRSVHKLDFFRVCLALLLAGLRASAYASSSGAFRGARTRADSFVSASTGTSLASADSGGEPPEATPYASSRGVPPGADEEKDEPLDEEDVIGLASPSAGALDHVQVSLVETDVENEEDGEEEEEDGGASQQPNEWSEVVDGGAHARALSSDSAPRAQTRLLFSDGSSGRMATSGSFASLTWSGGPQRQKHRHTVADCRAILPPTPAQRRQLAQQMLALLNAAQLSTLGTDQLMGVLGVLIGSLRIAQDDAVTTDEATADWTEQVSDAARIVMQHLRSCLLHVIQAAEAAVVRVNPAASTSLIDMARQMVSADMTERQWQIICQELEAREWRGIVRNRQDHILQIGAGLVKVIGKVTDCKNNTLSAWRARFMGIKTTTRETARGRMGLSLDMAEADVKEFQREWRFILKTLTDERGPWGAGWRGEESDQFWTLDVRPVMHGMRFRLLRNGKGTRHERASLLFVEERRKVGVPSVASGESGAAEGAASEADGTDATTSKDFLWQQLQKSNAVPAAGAAAAGDAGVSEEVADDSVIPSTPSGALDEEEKSMLGASGEVAPTVLFAQGSSGGVGVPSLGASAKKPAIQERCQIISPMCTTAGMLCIREDTMEFIPDDVQEDAITNPVPGTPKEYQAQLMQSLYTKTFRVKAVDIEVVEKRRYQLRHIAFEVFLKDRTSFFVNMLAPNKCETTLRAVNRMGPSKLVLTGINNLRKSLTEAWQNRRISNFEYLLRLNRLAGRTFNDLSQYPIFPWVVRDYTSEKLDLNDPQSFRDLRFPMGAQTEERREHLKRKYQDAEANRKQLLEIESDQQILMFAGPPPWHFGTFYLNPGGVIWYLIRLEPFTTFHIVLQDGKFDRPDRQFHSVGQAYIGVTTNDADVKEVPPEFYCNPNMFRNMNRVDMGMRQNMSNVGDVDLPPWARGNPEVFVALQREALESQYVSDNLHHWVDLVFGVKQRGPNLPGGSMAAVEAVNVYFHLMYEGAVNLESLSVKDPDLFRRVLSTIDNYGQMPPVLLSEPHPSRIKVDVSHIPMFSRRSYNCPQCLSVVGVPKQERKEKQWPKKFITYPEVPFHTSPVVFIGTCRSDFPSVITVDRHREWGHHQYIHNRDATSRFLIDARLPAIAQGALTHAVTGPASVLQFEPTRRSGSRRPVGIAFATRHRDRHVDPLFWAVDNASSAEFEFWLTAGVFALSPNGQYLYIGALWDDSFKTVDMDTGRVVQSVAAHSDVVTCIALDGQYLVTGSLDATVRVWKVKSRGGGVEPTCLHVLTGHDDAVSSVAVQDELDTVVSASKDGTLIVYTLRTGEYIRSLCPDIAKRCPITWVGLSSAGFIASYCKDGRILATWSFNGHKLASMLVNDALRCLIWSEDGCQLIVGGDARKVHVFDAQTLKSKRAKMFGFRPDARDAKDSKDARDGAKDKSDAGVKESKDGDKAPRRIVEFSSAICSLALAPHESALFVGLDSGAVAVISSDASFSQRKFIENLKLLGFHGEIPM